MIYLIISLTFYSSLAFAAFISVDVTGKDNISGFLSENGDFFIVSATIDTKITPDMISTNYPETAYFQDCKDNAGGSICAYQSPVRDFSSGEQEFTLTQYGSEKQILSSYIGSIVVDSVAPVISGIMLSTSGDNYSLSYAVEDKSCDFCNGMCSGLSKLVIEANDNIKEFSLDSTTCKKSGVIKGLLADFGITDGTIGFCVTAIDKIGLVSSEKCQTNIVDTIKPKFIIGSFAIKDAQGNKMAYYPSVQAVVSVDINITDDNLDIAEVYMNLSAFDSGSGLLDKVPGTCIETSESIYLCSWTGIMFGGYDSGNGAASFSDVQVSFSAEDSSGNIGIYKQQLSLAEDIIPPTVLRVYTSDVNAGETSSVSLKNGLNFISVELADDTSGYSNKNVYLDISSFSDSLNSVKADRCISDENGWLCTFNVTISAKDGKTGKVIVLSKSSDDAGNRMSKSFNVGAIVDSSAPSIKEITMKNPCPYSGQDMEIDIIVDDNSPVVASVKPGKITNTNELIVSECTELSATERSCKLIITDLVSKHVTEKLQINITDPAKNTFIKSFDVEVCEAKTGVPKSQISVTAMPVSKIDLRALSMIDYPAIVSLSITADSGDIIESSIKCSPNVGSVHLLDEDTDNPVLSMKIKQSSNATTGRKNILVECVLSSVFKSGGKVYTEPESDNISIYFTAYNNPLGTVDKSIKDKIKAIDEDIKSTDQEIESWEKWNKWLSMLCSMAEMLATVDAVLGAVKAVVYGIAIGLTSVCPGEFGYDAAICQAGWGLWDFVCEYTTIYDGFINEFIWTPGFALSFAMIPKWLCMIYSCKLCTMDDGKALADLTGIDGGIVKIVSAGAAVVFTGGASILANAGLATSATSAVAGWTASEKPNTINYILGGFTMDPYKSINAASSCLCIPGIIYNLKKEKQIQCRYKTCINKNSKLGLPLDTCDDTYAVQRCLYVDGAQWKLIGSESMGIIGVLFSFVMRNLAILVAGTAWQDLCPPIEQFVGCAMPPQIPISSYDSPLSNLLCHVSGAALMIVEIGEFSLNTDMDKYSGELKGETVC